MQDLGGFVRAHERFWIPQVDVLALSWRSTGFIIPQWDSDA